MTAQKLWPISKLTLRNVYYLYNAVNVEGDILPNDTCPSYKDEITQETI
jgi:hypothetical protein